MSFINSSNINGINSCLNEKALLDNNIPYLDRKKIIYEYNLKKYETKNKYNKSNCQRLKDQDKYKNFSIFENREKNLVKKYNKFRINLSLKKFNKKNKDNDNKSQHNPIYITENIINGDYTKLPLLLEKINDYQSKNISINQNLNISKNNSINNIKEINKTFLSKSIEEKGVEKLENKNTKNCRTLFLNRLKFNLKKEELNKKHISKTSSCLLIKKNILLNGRNFIDKSKSTYINKLNQFIINKKYFELKNEQYKQIIEIKKNKIEEVNDKINSLKKSYKLFENKFLAKYNELIRSVNIELDHENNIDLNLCTKTYLLRNEIKMLEKKIMKLTNEKNMYSKWMDLQILIKEKILGIPKEFIFVSYGNKNKFKIPNEKNEIAIKYKNNISYKTPEDLIKQLKKYEDEDINLIKKLNENYFEIDSLKEELEKEKQGYLNNYFIKEINNKIKLREIVIEKNKELQRKKLYIKKNYNHFSIVNNKSNYPYIKNKHSKLYNKIKLIKSNIIEEKEEDNEEGIVKIIKKIEIILDECLKKKKIYLEKYKSRYEEEKAKLEEIKKKKRIKLHQEYLHKRFLELKEKIIQKANKIYFLPNKNCLNYNFNKEYSPDVKNNINIEENCDDYVLYNDNTEIE